MICAENTGCERTRLRSEIRYCEAMHPKSKGKLAVVMIVMADEVPDHLLASIGVELIAVSPFDHKIKVGNGPGIKCLLDCLPGRLQPCTSSDDGRISRGAGWSKPSQRARASRSLLPSFRIQWIMRACAATICAARWPIVRLHHSRFHARPRPRANAGRSTGVYSVRGTSLPVLLSLSQHSEGKSLVPKGNMDIVVKQQIEQDEHRHY
jgi:hypothetical protein